MPHHDVVIQGWLKLENILVSYPHNQQDAGTETLPRLPCSSL